ncbi:MAG: hypothetical protein M1282_11860 [Chloroflexi bacterium]|nr:hypothetical protein [Chloroflexota bacterium]
MRRFCFLTLLALSISACATNVKPSPTATIVPSATVSPTSTSTVTPTVTSSPTATPITIENMPPGVAFPLELRSSKGNPIVNGTFSSHVVDGTLYGGIPLFQHRDDPLGHDDLMPFYLFCESVVSCPYFHAVERDGLAFKQTPELTGYMYGPLLYRYAADNHVKWQGSTTIGGQVIDLVQQGKLPINFVTTEGDFAYYPSRTNGYRVFVVSWESTGPEQDPRYLTMSNGTEYSERVMTTMDEQGNLIFVFATKPPYNEIANNIVLRKWFLYDLFSGLARVIDNPDQSLTYLRNHQAYNGVTIQIGYWALSPSTPSMTVSDSP